MTQQALTEEHVPLYSRISISAADAAIAILQTVVGGGALTYYYTRVAGLDEGKAGLVWLIFGIWNAINDPLFGFISDRTKSNLGRRIPYIRYGAPIIAIGFILFWINFSNTQAVLFWQMLISLFIYDTLYTAIATSIYIMPFEMAVSNKARSTIFIWKIIFMIPPNVFPFVLASIQPGPGQDPTNYRWFMIGLAMVVCLIVIASTFFYKEKHFQQEEVQPPFFTAIKESFKNVPFLIFLVSSFTIIYAQTNLLQGVAYYFDEIIKANQLPIYIGLAIGIVLGIFLWVRQRDRWGVKRCLLTWLALFSIGCFWLLFFGKTAIMGMIGFFFIGIGFSGGMYLIPIMNGDVVDYDEERTGLRREGMYAGINSLVTKPAISIAQSAFLAIIAAAGYMQDLPKGQQPVSVHSGILTAWVLIPGLLLALTFLATLTYPQTGAKWDETKKKIAALHDEKEKRFMEEHGYQFVK
jgi:GPH family glycoside/pentoside/hexuronide:cation symporter